MPSSPAFDWLCTELERVTDFDRLEARGTVRIALKGAGLSAENVSPDQMRVVIEMVLPAELISRGIEDAQEQCALLASVFLRWTRVALPTRRTTSSGAAVVPRFCSRANA